MNSLTSAGAPPSPTSASRTSAGPPSTQPIPAPQAPIIPVAAAETQAPPAAALDKVASEGGSIFDKALGMAQPYLAKVESVAQQVTASSAPYAEKAMDRLSGVIDKLEGHPTAAAAAAPDAVPTLAGDKSVSSAPAVPAAGASSFPGTLSSGAPSTTSTAAPSLEDRLDGVFASIGRRASQVAAKIDEKTATAEHPGLFSQVASAVQKVTDKADAYMSSHAPGATNPTSTIGHPVETTTNTVPHTDKPAEASTSLPASSLPVLPHA